MTKLGVPLVLVAALLSVSACSSGQTGSPECAAVTTCACQSLVGREVFRGHIVGLENATVEVEVEELYSPSSSPVFGPGERGTFPYTVGPSHCDDPAQIPTLEVGDTVLGALDFPAGEMWLVPWTDPLDLGDRQVPVETLAERADANTCDADLEQPPCNDVIENTSCSTDPRRGTAPGLWAMAMFFLGLSLRRFGGPRRGRA